MYLFTHRDFLHTTHGTYALFDARMHLFMTVIFLETILAILVFASVLDSQHFGHASVHNLHIYILQ